MSALDFGQAFDVVKSNTESERVFNWIICNTAGTITGIKVGGGEFTITVPASAWVPVGQCTAIKTSSTASGILAV